MFQLAKMRGFSAPHDDISDAGSRRLHGLMGALDIAAGYSPVKDTRTDDSNSLYVLLIAIKDTLLRGNMRSAITPQAKTSSTPWTI